MINDTYIFDLDGTLANISHRLHYINSENKDWDSFFKACINDEPIVDNINLLTNLYLSNYCTIIILSGRSEIVRKETEEWLDKYLNIIPYKLYMRKAGDHRPDYEYKEEWLINHSEEYPRYKISGVFEDRKQVVDMWRRHGLTCYQVNDECY